MKQFASIIAILFLAVSANAQAKGDKHHHGKHGHHHDDHIHVYRSPDVRYVPAPAPIFLPAPVLPAPPRLPGLPPLPRLPGLPHP